MKAAGLPFLFGRQVRHLHAVGVGGMGLGPLAIFAARRGWTVSGEDDAMNPAMARELSVAGVRLGAVGVMPPETDLVVYSSAVKVAHPALAEARGRGITTVRRGELLAEVAREHRLVGVAGSHGKTTTTAMIIAALRSEGVSAGYVLGGLFNDPALPPAALGESDWLVAEIDESDGTIDGFSPEITVLVNLDWDHADRYPDAAQIDSAFAALAGRTRRTLLAWDGCAKSARITGAAEQGGARVITFGASGDFKATHLAGTPGELELALGGRFAVPRVKVRASGSFNAVNAAAALATVQLMGGSLATHPLAEFPGVRRRQTVLHRDDALTVIEDYAHHPAEIRALLQSLRRDLRDGGRLRVVFQPHRFSRTRQFKTEFAAVLAVADAIALLDVYGAGEAPLPGGTTADLYAELVRAAPDRVVDYLPGDPGGVLELVRQAREPGDCVVFVGAGDIEHRAREWIDMIKQEVRMTAEWDDVAAALRAAVSAETRIRREEPLANKTTLRVGGAARVYAEPATADDLAAILRTLHARGVPLQVLGRGSNLLIPDAGVDGVVVSLRQPSWEAFEVLADGRVRVGAGLRLKNLCGLAAAAGLVGFEFLEGIPGNVGGALRMNAGAMGGWMFDVVDTVEALALDGTPRQWTRAAMTVSYRHCAELAGAIATGAILQPKASSGRDDVSRQIDVYRSKRQESQPREPSAGCIFKNPPDDSAGRLIDACGLKGERIGDAEVSTVHGNFIINRGHATSADVIDLVRRVRERVASQTGVTLEPEVLLYGAEWEDNL